MTPRDENSVSDDDDSEEIQHEFQLGLSLDRDPKLTKRYIRCVTYTLAEHLSRKPIVVYDPPYVLERKT